MSNSWVNYYLYYELFISLKIILFIIIYICIPTYCKNKIFTILSTYYFYTGIHKSQIPLTH